MGAVAARIQRTSFQANRNWGCIARIPSPATAPNRMAYGFVAMASEAQTPALQAGFSPRDASTQATAAARAKARPRICGNPPQDRPIHIAGFEAVSAKASHAACGPT